MNEEQLNQKQALHNLLCAMAEFKKSVGDYSTVFNDHDGYFIERKLAEVDQAVRNDYFSERQKEQNKRELDESSKIIEDFYKANFMELNDMPILDQFSRTLNVKESDIDEINFPMDLEEPVQKLKPRK